MLRRFDEEASFLVYTLCREGRSSAGLERVEMESMGRDREYGIDSI